ncbi:MAG: hypothetical protein EA341_09795 [Mongoliibacter sp.]|uniref:ThiF family adenylyltransferase n=1 Tax=Mongoliibacter sp. TaxID=2022438 RepID=UPI0012F38C69|nr:ThiF family adenylyltransferase [Mongoliibacter sp.]TVP49143.1 MAG: hypothetical protein EA341_09795 [Mongoliibacter sp.]
MKIIDNLNDLDQSKHHILHPEDSFEDDLIYQLKSDPTVRVLDQINIQIAEWIKLSNPKVTFSKGALQDEVRKFLKKKGGQFGNWVYYPWNNSIVRILPEDEFIQVRTIRNKYKITEEEQQILRTKKIGIIGLSVGQSVALGLAIERVFGELVIADFDHLELGNMNRIRTSLVNLGVKKTTIVKREIAEIDPYLKVTVFEEGLHDDNMEEFFCEDGTLDLLIEECDNIKMKIQCRLMAKSLGIPVLMDTSDRGMLDIERFDLDSKLPLFNGKLKEFGSESGLLDNFEKKQKQILGAILDFDKLSKRAQESIGEIGKSITNWPQLASSVIMGGGICTHLSREILLGQKIKSGRFYVDLDEIVK